MASRSEEMKWIYGGYQFRLNLHSGAEFLDWVVSAHSATAEFHQSGHPGSFVVPSSPALSLNFTLIQNH